MGRKFAELIPTTGRYVDGADKAMLAADPDAEKADERAAAMRGPVALRLIGATLQPRARFGPRWLVNCRPMAGGEDIAIDFAAAAKDGAPIEARMNMFGELHDSLDAGEAWDPVILARVPGVKGGNPFWTFLDCPPELVADPVAPVFYADDDEESEPEPVKPKGPRLAKATARK